MRTDPVPLLMQAGSIGSLMYIVGVELKDSERFRQAGLMMWVGSWVQSRPWSSELVTYATFRKPKN